MRGEAKGLVLAGGGAKGSYQVGVYQALREVGWQPELITGTSVGALNGALFVMGDLAEAEQLWQTLDVHGVLEVPQGKKPEELRDFLLDVLRSGGMNIEPLGSTIDDYLDEGVMRASAIRYGLVMTEMNTLRSHQYTLEEIPRGRLKEYMMASSACFPALRPQAAPAHGHQPCGFYRPLWPADRRVCAEPGIQLQGVRAAEGVPEGHAG